LDKVQVYPNPIKDKLYMRLAPDIVQAGLTIYSETGELLLQKKNIHTTETIDLNGFEAGIYILSVTRGEKVLLTEKIALTK
jgi:hypothetical protein